MGRKQATAIAKKFGHEIGSTEPEAQGKPNPDDPTHQDAVLNPKPKIVALSFDENVQLFPLSIKVRRQAWGFVYAVNRMAMGVSKSVAEMGTEIMSLINRRDDLSSELFRLFTLARFQPGKAPEEKLPGFIEELEEQATPSDVLVMFACLADLSGANTPDPKAVAAIKKLIAP